MVMVWILYLLATLAVPAFIIYFIVKALTKNKTGKEAKSSGIREVFLYSVVITALIAGFAGISLIPMAFFGVEEFAGNTAALTIYIISSMILIMVGSLLKEVTGRFLMALGIIFLIFSVVPYISNFKTFGGFFLVLIVFVLLVVLLIRSSRKDRDG